MGKVTPAKRKVETVRVPSENRNPYPSGSDFPGSNRSHAAFHAPSSRVPSVRFADSQIPSTDFISRSRFLDSLRP